MFKPSHNIYTIKTSPINDNEKLEKLLNKMSIEGWELYSMQEIESENDIYYNCIFLKEIDDDAEASDDFDLLDFRPKIERIINPELDPYELCIDILKKIKDKRSEISQVKSLIDGTSEDSRAVLNEKISKYINELGELKTKLLEVINPDIMEKRLGEAKLVLALSEELAPLLDSGNENNLLPQLVLLRQNFTEKSGYIIPKVKIEIDDSLDENEFSIKVRGIPAVNSYAYPERLMFIRNGLNIEQMPENSIKTKDAASNQAAIWINEETAEDYWVKGANASEYICSVLEYAVIKHIEEIFDYSDVNRYLEIAGNQNLFLIDNIIPDFISIPELKHILTNLIKENVSIKDIVFILEKINDLSFLEDKDDILPHLRAALSRQICASLCCEKDNVISAYALSRESEEIFDDIEEDGSGIIRINKDKINTLIEKIQQKIKKNEVEAGRLILAAPIHIRHIVFLALCSTFPNIRVTAKEEISSDYLLKIKGKI